MSETPLYKPEKFISSSEPLLKHVLKEISDYHLCFKHCQWHSRARLQVPQLRKDAIFSVS